MERSSIHKERLLANFEDPMRKNISRIAAGSAGGNINTIDVQIALDAGFSRDDVIFMFDLDRASKIPTEQDELDVEVERAAALPGPRHHRAGGS